MTSRTSTVLLVLLGLLIASTAHAGDCFNDDVTASSDLEPPAPGTTADLLRITDDDVERILQKIAAYERNRAPFTEEPMKPR